MQAAAAKPFGPQPIKTESQKQVAYKPIALSGTFTRVLEQCHAITTARMPTLLVHRLDFRQPQDQCPLLEGPSPAPHARLDSQKRMHAGQSTTGHTPRTRPLPPRHAHKHSTAWGHTHKTHELSRLRVLLSSKQTAGPTSGTAKVHTLVDVKMSKRCRGAAEQDHTCHSVLATRW
jgi:hypothetical protein